MPVPGDAHLINKVKPSKQRKEDHYMCRKCSAYCKPDEDHLCHRCAYLANKSTADVNYSPPRPKKKLPEYDEKGGQESWAIRKFETGATRDTAEGKYDYEGFLSPLVLQRFAAYMHKHRQQSDGGMRDSDNWQKGIPQDAYVKSGFRHFMDWWLLHRGYDATRPETGESQDMEEALCGLLFNVQGYLHELLKDSSASEKK